MPHIMRPVLPLAALTALALAAPAHAATVEVRASSGQAVFTAAKGERNDVTVASRDGAIVFTDAAARMEAGGGCDASGACAGSATTVVDLGDGDDAIRARNGVRDVIRCGAGIDNGEADAADSVAPDCEGVIQPDKKTRAAGDDLLAGGPRPEAGKSFRARVKSGVVLVKLPGAAVATPFDPALPLPIGAEVDTTRGVVSLVSAADAAGAVQAADFTGAVFAVFQKPGAFMTTELRLRGGDFGQCAASAPASGTAARAAAAPKKVRRLWGSGKGRFTTRGKNAAATVRGTVWSVTDRCDGTFTRVESGIVVVKDLLRLRTKVVRAGESLLIPKKRRARR